MLSHHNFNFDAMQVALLGRPDLHAAAGEFLRSQHKPPINSIGVTEPASAARLFGTLPPALKPCCGCAQQPHVSFIPAAAPAARLPSALLCRQEHEPQPCVPCMVLSDPHQTGGPAMILQLQSAHGLRQLCIPREACLRTHTRSNFSISMSSLRRHSHNATLSQHVEGAQCGVAALCRRAQAEDGPRGSLHRHRQGGVLSPR